MNKYNLLLVMILVFIALKSTGQEERKGLEAETQFFLFQPQSNQYVPNLKLRYFLSENLAVRTTVNYRSEVTLREIDEVNGEGVGSVEKNSSLLALSIGMEKHYPTGKVSPYFGAEIKFFSGKNDEYGSRTDSITFIPNYNYTKKVSIGGFGVQFFTGVDIDLYSNLYVGTELGFMYQKVIEKRGTFNVKDANSLTANDVTTPISSKTYTNFNLVNLGVIRVGWRF